MVSEIIQRILDRITPEQEERVSRQMDIWSPEYIYSDWYDVDYSLTLEDFEEMNAYHLDVKYCLPYRESIQRSNIYAQTWDTRRKSDYHKVDGYYPWKRIDRILENNIGKSFDGAFSYYCRKSPKYQQKLFEETINRNWSRRWGKDYIVDENGLIQGNPDRHKKYSWNTPPYKIQSWDCVYDYGWYSDNNEKAEGVILYDIRFTLKENTKYKWKKVILQGKEYEFESKDYRYHRCKKEQEQKRKKYNRQLSDK